MLERLYMLLGELIERQQDVDRMFLKASGRS